MHPKSIVTPLFVLLALAAPARADIREQITRFFALDGKLDEALPEPRKLLDPAERDKLKEPLLPILRDMRSVLREIESNPRYGGLAEYRLIDVIAMLHLLGDEEAQSWLTEGLKEDANQRLDANSVKTALDFATAADDAARTQAVDTFAKLAADHADRHQLGGVAYLVLALTQPGPLEDRVLDTVRKKLSSSTAGEVALKYEAPRKLRGNIGKPVNFRATAIGGRVFQASELRGKVLLLHFFATFNQASLDEVRKINRIQVLNKAKGLEVLSVSSDREKPDLTLWLERNKRVNWPVLFDEFTAEASQQWHPLTLQFGISKLPSTLLIDRKGVLRFANPTDLDARVKELLDEK